METPSQILRLSLLLSCCLVLVHSSTVGLRSSKRLHFPALGLGPSCHGCPVNFCDDDQAIVYGYCCGCARFYDVLPVICPVQLQCPLNLYEVCEDYEYMMHCCCSG